MSGTTMRVRSRPCMGCGGKIVVVETHRSALGGLIRRAPAVAVQHADFEPGPGRHDAIDDRCRRAPEQPA